jgi:hypothetical protein
MGGPTGGAHQVARLDGINGGSAYAHLSIFGQAAGSHTALLAAHASATNVAGHHFICAAEGCAYP